MRIDCRSKDSIHAFRILIFYVYNNFSLMFAFYPLNYKKLHLKDKNFIYKKNQHNHHIISSFLIILTMLIRRLILINYSFQILHMRQYTFQLNRGVLRFLFIICIIISTTLMIILYLFHFYLFSLYTSFLIKLKFYSVTVLICSKV